MGGYATTEYFGYHRYNKETEWFDFHFGFGGKLKYPEGVIPDITDSLTDYHDALNSVAKFIFACIENSLYLERDSLLNLHEGAVIEVGTVNNYSHISSLLYRHSSTKDERVELMERHTDKSSITFLQATAPGLQVENRQTGGFEVDKMEGAIFLQVGDLLEFFTGGRYRAAVHRVRHLDSHCEERQSLAYFVHPVAETMIEPFLPTLQNSRRCPEMSAGNYFEDKVIYQ